MTENPPPPATVGNIELRGYELAKLTHGGWERIATYRPTELGRQECIKSARWLGERWPKESYRARILVSMEPQAAEPALDLTSEAP